MVKKKKKNIPSAIYYPIPLHLQKAYASLGYETGSLPVCEEIALDIMALPMHPYLEPDEQNLVIEAVRGACV